MVVESAPIVTEGALLYQVIWIVFDVADPPYGSLTVQL